MTTLEALFTIIELPIMIIVIFKVQFTTFTILRVVIVLNSTFTISAVINIIIKQVASFKLSLLLKEFFTNNTNITTKLNWKLFTKLIRAKQRSLGLHRQRG